VWGFGPGPEIWGGWRVVLLQLEKCFDNSNRMRSSSLAVLLGFQWL
jgi:hypothetical protein